KIYVANDRLIVTSLPIGFFGNAPTRRSDEAVEDVFAYMYADNEDKIKTDESKLFVIGRKSGETLQGSANLAGHVKDIDSGEPIIGALVYIENPRIGVATDQFGYYSITLPRGRHELHISSVGMKNTTRQIMLYADGKLSIELKEDVTPLREIVVESEKDANVMSMQ